MSTDREGDTFTVICKRYDKQFEVIRNWGGGIRREGVYRNNPAKCSCGSLQLEIY